MREIKLDDMLFNTISKRPKAVENCILLIVKFYKFRTRCLLERLSPTGCLNFIKEYHDIEEQIARQKSKHNIHTLK